jgi:HSP90 family molecular chaperone
MTSLLETFNVTTDFDGLIGLVARNLYSEPDVFLRELVQNAHDAIVLRQVQQRGKAGRIDIRFDPGEQTISVSDDGLGMDAQDIRNFLSVIGASGKTLVRASIEEKDRAAAERLIGQFGIGLLSAFVVARKVVARTRKVGADRAFAWHNAGSMKCELHDDPRQQPGTEVIVHLQDRFSWFLDADRLKSTVIKYMDLLETPIFVQGEGPVNLMNAPWHQKWSSERNKERAYRDFLARRYPAELPIDVIPLKIDEPHCARGALSISAHTVSDAETGGLMDVFVRRSFVRGEDRELLPAWARFVRGVLDSPDLQPNAARDNVQRKEPAFEFLQKHLGQVIVERLKYLARSEPHTFEAINACHHHHLKRMAVRHEDFFHEVGDLLLFDTNKGRTCLRDYLARSTLRPTTNRIPIYYFSHNGADAQFFRLANARGWVVIDAGAAFDEELLETYARANARVELVSLDDPDHPELFREVPAGPAKDRLDHLAGDLERLLKKGPAANVVVEARAFQPATLPAALISTRVSQAEQTLRELNGFAQLLAGFSSVAGRALEEGQGAPMRLFLNAENPLVRRLAELPDRTRPPNGDLLLALYHSALLLSRNLLTGRHAEAIHQQVLRLLALSLGPAGRSAEQGVHAR